MRLSELRTGEKGVIVNGYIPHILACCRKVGYSIYLVRLEVIVIRSRCRAVTKVGVWTYHFAAPAFQYIDTDNVFGLGPASRPKRCRTACARCP